LLSIQGDLVELSGLRHRHEVEIARMQRELEAADRRLSHLEGANAEIRGALAAADAERYRLRELQPALEESEQTNAALFAEVGRLQTLLDTIFKSRTWKLHNIVDRLRGNG
ncbi:MAG TPA: hypothetical protein VIO12_07580, partial [Thermoanaerobaculia bacterium]